MVACLAGTSHLLGGFYAAHSSTTDAVVTIAGVQVTARLAIAGAQALLRPIVERVGEAYYKASRHLREDCYAPLWMYTAPASLCCLEGVVKRRVLRRRQSVPVRVAQTHAVAKQALVPTYDSEQECHVVYEHISGKPKRLRIKEIKSSGEITWEVIRSEQQHLTPKAAPLDEGNEKRVKKLDVVPGWSQERIAKTFKFITIILLDGSPYGFGFRVDQDHFHTPYHMGPLEGRRLEICGVADYVRDGPSCEKVELDQSKVEVTTLDYSGCRSKTGFDQMLVRVGRLAFARAGIATYNQSYDKNLLGEVIALGFNMALEGAWKELVVHRGFIEQQTGAFTAITGTRFHTVNTECGWSGTPLMRLDNGVPIITGVHISAVPGPAPYNIAITAPMLEKLVRCRDNAYVPSLNCPFKDMVFKIDSEDETVMYLTDEKSTSAKIRTGMKRAARAKAGKAKGRQAGAPKRNVRKGASKAGWTQHTKKKGIGSSRLSSATYDKLKQASSLLGNSNPAHMAAVHKTYGKMMRIEEELDEKRNAFMEDPDNEDLAEEISRLERTQEAILRNFTHDVEARVRSQMRSGPPRQAAASTARWADAESDDDEEEEEIEVEGFWGNGNHDECVHYPHILWTKAWGSHDPDNEARMIGDEARRREAEKVANPSAAFPTACEGNEPFTLNQTPGVKKKVVKFLLDLPLSEEGIEKRTVISAYTGKIRRNDGTEQMVLSDEYTFLKRRMDAQRTRTVCIFEEGAFHWFHCEPVNAGDISEMLVTHTIERDAQFTETLPATQVTSDTARWWLEAWPQVRYVGDTGGSEKRDSVKVKLEDVTKGDQKSVYDRFYRDTVSDSLEGVRPHRKLVSVAGNDEEVNAALDKYFSVAGKVSDLEAIMNCNPALIWKRPEATAYKQYMRSGGIAWSSEEGEVIPDSNGERCFSAVGYHARMAGEQGESEYTKVTRRVKRAVRKVIASGVTPGVQEDLLNSLKYVMPPGNETAMIKSLRGQSAKQRVARPSLQVRSLLKHIARSFQEHYPPCEWSLDSHSIGEVLDHHITVADDKSIGWTGYLYPGKRGNIQKCPEKRQMIIGLAKFRMALRFSWANSLHSLSPKEMVELGLRDPAMAFIKGESHPPRKVESGTWRLIWTLSEVDRLLDAAVFTDQDKADIETFQSGHRTEDGRLKAPLGEPMELAVGVGHDDRNLERTFHELECLLGKSKDQRIRASDASGWDFSVSAASFWTSMEARFCRAQSTTHFRTLLIGGFFQSAWLLSTGNTLWQCERFGITASGSSITTSSNGIERSSGSKLGQLSRAVGGASVIEAMSPPEIKQLAERKDIGTASTGDDNLHSHDVDYEIVRSLGTILREVVQYVPFTLAMFFAESSCRSRHASAG